MHNQEWKPNSEEDRLPSEFQYRTRCILGESQGFELVALAEEVGFEPTNPCGFPVFKTGAIGHSATLPITE